jgi:hypothetical protein
VYRCVLCMCLCSWKVCACIVEMCVHVGVLPCHSDRLRIPNCVFAVHGYPVPRLEEEV